MFSWKTPDYYIVDSLKKLERLSVIIEEQIDNGVPICLDVETTGPSPESGLDPYHGWLMGISIAFDTDKGWYIPIGHEEIGPNKIKRLKSGQCKLQDVVRLFNPIFSKKGVYILHNAKFDYKFLWRAGIHLNPCMWDTMIAHKLLAGNTKVDSKLKTLIKQYVNIPPVLVQTFDEVVSYDDFSLTSIESMHTYAINDVIFTLYIYKGMKPEIDSTYKKLFYEAEMPVVPILGQMEMMGIRLDIKYLASIKPDLERYRKRIYNWCNEKWGINVGSNQQVGEVLKERLKIKSTVKTPSGGVSTSKEALQKMLKSLIGSKPHTNESTAYKLARRVIVFRAIDKALGTYIDKFPKIARVYYDSLGNETDRIIHTNFTQIINSGRMSSSPNVQNIPRETLVDIRRGFVSRKGKYFVDSDYKGQELRIVTAISGEPRMQEAFLKDPLNADLHTLTTQGLFGIDKPTSEQRYIGKTINFSILYGATEYSVSKTLNCSLDEALSHIETFYSFYLGLREWRTEEENKILQNGYSETLFGRRRYMEEGLSPTDKYTKWKYEAAVRRLINHIIQGTSADILKFTLAKLCRRFAEADIDAYPITTIHDSIVVETSVPEEAAEIIKDTMEVTINGVFLPIDMEIRKSFSKRDSVQNF